MELYYLFVFSKDLSTLETYKKLLQQQKSDYPGGFDYNNFDARGYFTVVSNLDPFIVGDTISTDAGASTAEIYRIVGLTFYVKDIVGSFDNMDTITDGGIKSCDLTANTTLIIYPYRIDIYPEEISDTWVKLMLEAWWIL